MEEQLVSFKTAVLAKDCGFKESCNHRQSYNLSRSFQNDVVLEELHYKDNIVMLPTQSHLLKWLRDVHKIFVTVRVDSTLEPKFCYSLKWVTAYSDGSFEWMSTNHQDYTYNGKPGQHFSDLFYTYEEALEEGLYEALHLIK